MNARLCPSSFQIDLPSEADTEALAHLFADHAAPGLTVLLEGPIGAGKTFFARALIQTLQARSGRVEDVPSPTFTLVQVYETGRFETWHADLYRLSAPEDILDLGLDAAFEEAMCLIEWPDRLGDLAPRNAVHITLKTQGTAHQCRIEAANLPEQLARDLRDRYPP